jgi:hypothetical protein
MSNFYSSKSLLDVIGKESAKSETSEKQPENSDSQHNSYLLASTLQSVDKPESELGSDDTNQKDEQFLKKNEKIIAGNKFTDDLKIENNNSDQDSITSDDIIMDTTIKPKSLSIKSKTLELLKLLNPSNLLASHDLLLGSFYEEHKYELVKQKKIVLRVITWNLNQMKPPNLKELAGESGRDWASFFYAGDETINNENPEGLADIYLINFQETISLKSFSKSNNAIDEWVNFLLHVLNAISSNPYTLVYKTGLLGLTTIILARETITADELNGSNGQIYDIRENSIGLGYLRWANKGCVSIRFRIGGISLGIGKCTRNQNLSMKDDSYAYQLKELDETIGKIPGVEVQILNVHLVHGEDESQIKQRWDSWDKIEKKIGLADRTVKLAFDPTVTAIKDEAQKRLESKLKEKLHSQSDVDHSNYHKVLEQEMLELSMNNDSIRTSSVPLKFSKIEEKKFEGIISNVDLSKFMYVTEAQKALIVCGDTNYRLDVPPDLKSQTIVQELVKNAEWEKITQHDQLTKQINLKKLFLGFTEPKINFAPTFKIINDSNGKWLAPTPPPSSMELLASNNKEATANQKQKNSTPYYIPRYDAKRLPAYTDRILHTERPYFNLINGTYSSVATKGSDHLPVAASYVLDAPLIDETKLHFLKGKFTKAWDAVINKFKFFNLEESVIINHKINELTVGAGESKVEETVYLRSGHIQVSAISGESIELLVNVQNLIDESFSLNITEQTSRGWFGTKIAIDFKEIDNNNNVKDVTSSYPFGTIQSHEKGQIIFSMKCSSTNVLERAFIVEIPEFSLCPAYRKYIALTINIKDIFGTSFENLSKQQFTNIQKCFAFILKSSSKDLLLRIKDLSSPTDLNACEWDLVREVTLWEFSESKYSSLNVKGNGTIRNEDALSFNFGTITVMSFIYLWLKTQGDNFNTSSERGKIVFANVIRLIKYFKMDAENGYFWFGWLFADEYELNSYLDRDFDVKLDL